LYFSFIYLQRAPVSPCWL